MRLLVDKIKFYYLPLVFWSALIFFFSSIPGNGEYGYDLWFFLKRKSAHIFEYAVLSFLWVRVFWLHYKDEDNHCYHWGIFASFTYAVFDEIHQVFVFGRTGKITDVFIDLLGISLGAGAYWFYKHRMKKRAIEHTKRHIG